jgi:hypothetical protein
MGIKTSLAGVTFTAGAKANAVALGVDMTGFVADVQLAMSEVTTKMNFLINDVLTPAGTEAANITTLQAQITALS